VFDLLRERGVRIASFPLPISARLDRRNGRTMELTHDDHIDRGAALVQDRGGGHHLVLDPGYRTGPLTSPLPVDRSIDLVRRACDRIGAEVHVPETVSVPYATSAVGLGDGRVLVTGGDGECHATWAEAVGPENVVRTRTPFESYPVFAAAGIHCLVTELPWPLVGLTDVS
jgi:hypothetical protein